MRAALLVPFVTVFFATTACGSREPESHGVGGSSNGSGGTAGTVPTNTGGSGGTIVPQGGASGSSGATGTGGTGMPDLDTDVNVIITADNAYGFGYGTGTTVLNYFGGVENPRSQDIFSCPVGMGPESYVVPAGSANEGEFLYVIAYADKSTTQGVIAKFFREGAQAVFTGNGNWQVCATGQDRDPGDGGPTIDEINAELTNCNAGGTSLDTTSGGWVGVTASPRGNVVFGEDNSTDRGTPMPGNEFLIACEIDAEARWMWYEWETDRNSGSPFMWPGGTANVTKDFLIFRLGAEFIPGDPR